jgi:rod shape-determining protein MreC
MFRKSRTAVFGILILAVLLLLCIQRWTSGVKNIGTILLYPFSMTASLVGELGGAIKDRLVFQNQLVLENQLLKAQSSTNQLELLRLKELENENARLRQALNFQQSTPWKLKLARVIAREPSNWWRMIMIDAGSSSGVQLNQPVLATQGEAVLIGRVLEVGKWKSKVVLMGDPNCLVSAVVSETRNSGVIQPMEASSLDPTSVRLSYLSGGQQPLLPGYRVYTSGMGSMFPPGLYIGTIEESVEGEYGLHKEARVRLAVDANLLEEVWILIQ